LFNNLEIFDKRILVLYTLDISKKNLSLDQIVSFFNDFDDITYFDICEYINSLKNNNYIQEITDNGNTLYSITDSGYLILNELLELIPGVNLYNLKKILSKNIVNIKKGFEVGTNITPIKSDEFKISCYIKDGLDELLNISIYAGDKESTKAIEKNWNENSEEIYNTVLKLMTKQ
jgi:predicted transcriptional regulator